MSTLLVTAGGAMKKIVPTVLIAVTVMIVATKVPTLLPPMALTTLPLLAKTKKTAATAGRETACSSDKTGA
jgi:hypothetical protein